MLSRRTKSRTGTAVIKTEREWRQQLSPQQYAILREGGTERAGSDRYALSDSTGTYECAACGSELFDSASQYDSGTGCRASRGRPTPKRSNTSTSAGFSAPGLRSAAVPALPISGTSSRTASRPQDSGTA